MLAIANLRLGEQENCTGDAASNVCIIPLKGAAIHTKQEGARKAIALYSALLKTFPGDLGSRWLLNMAHMAIGGYPDSIPRGWRIGALQITSPTTFPQFPNVAGAVGVATQGLSGGLDAEDFNNDGLVDLLVTSWGMRDPITLYLADGTGGYRDVSATTGLAGITGGLNTTHADYDNDGDVDVFVMRGAWLADAGVHPNSLLRNDGHGAFTDVTIAAGLLAFHPDRKSVV